MTSPSGAAHATRRGDGPPTRRRPWLAAILSLLAPGVGQLYNGEPRKAYWLFALFIASDLLATAILNNSANRLAVGEVGIVVIGALALRVGATVDAYRRARRLGAILPGRSQRSWVYILLILISPALSAIVPAEPLMRSFHMPAGSMEPTILIGDYFIVDTGHYRRYPVKRGDVAVFKLPTAPGIDYVKRVVGLPGDRLQMLRGDLFINGEQVPRRPLSDYVYEGARSSTALRQYAEALPRGSGESPLEHRIVKIGNDGPLDNTPVYTVPSGHYFVLGDNRDNSQDSRVLSAVGYLPAERMMGRVGFVYFSTDGSARWWQIWKWPCAIRYGRLFEKID